MSTTNEAGSDPRARILIIAAVAGLLLVAGASAFLLVPRSAGGTVVSLTTAQPVSGATIESAAGTATSDDAGRFELAGQRLGTQEVTVTVAGFPPFKATVDVGALGGGESEIGLPDAKVTVRVEEVAAEKGPARSLKVMVGRVAASRTASGTYEAKGLRPGPAAITASDASHEPTKTAITLKPGANAVTLRVSLTPWETYSRYFQAYKSGRWAVAYSYLHPDVAKRESLATYTKDMKNWGMPLSTSLQSARNLPSWTSPSTNVAYPDVVEIRRTLTTNKQGARYVTSLPQHWANVGGMWLRVDL